MKARNKFVLLLKEQVDNKALADEKHKAASDQQLLG